MLPGESALVFPHARKNGESAGPETEILRLLPISRTIKEQP